MALQSMESLMSLYTTVGHTTADKLDTSKDIYVFTHGKRHLFQVIVKLCVDLGFGKEQIIAAKSTKVGNVGDYTASVWPPKAPSPDHIKIAQIMKAEKKTQRIVGLWAGVTQGDIGVAITLPQVDARNKQIRLYVTSLGVLSIVAVFIFQTLRRRKQ
eukprot:1036446_1